MLFPPDSSPPEHRLHSPSDSVQRDSFNLQASEHSLMLESLGTLSVKNELNESKLKKLTQFFSTHKQKYLI